MGSKEWPPYTQNQRNKMTHKKSNNQQMRWQTQNHDSTNQWWTKIQSFQQSNWIKQTPNQLKMLNLSVDTADWMITDQNSLWWYVSDWVILPVNKQQRQLDRTKYKWEIKQNNGLGTNHWATHHKEGLGTAAPTTDSEGVMSLWLLIWQVLNGNDNANSKIVLAKQLK